MELEEWTKIDLYFDYPKNEEDESHILTVLQKIKAEVTNAKGKYVEEWKDYKDKKTAIIKIVVWKVSWAAGTIYQYITEVVLHLNGLPVTNVATLYDVKANIKNLIFYNLLHSKYLIDMC